MSLIKNIILGWWYYVLYLVEGVNNKHYKMYANRKKHCNKCPFNRMGVCVKCGCIINAKCFSPYDECPEMLW